MLGLLLASVVGSGVVTPDASRPARSSGTIPTPPSLEASEQFYEDAVTTTTTTEPPTTTTLPTTVVLRPTGPRSYEWWEAIAQCESGNTNGWRTGYYGIEASYPIGHLSKAEQLAWAERIYADYGDRAWGCAPVAWRQVPNG